MFSCTTGLQQKWTVKINKMYVNYCTHQSTAVDYLYMYRMNTSWTHGQKRWRCTLTHSSVVVLEWTHCCFSQEGLFRRKPPPDIIFKTIRRLEEFARCWSQRLWLLRTSLGPTTCAVLWLQQKQYIPAIILSDWLKEFGLIDPSERQDWPG